MNAETIEAIEASLAGSLAGRMSFPDVVRQLAAHGVESYHVDLYRAEKTTYLPNGESHVAVFTLQPASIAETFSAEGVVNALRTIQHGEIDYPEFLHRIRVAGTTGYVVYLSGRCVVYTGRDGSLHIEHFPTVV